MNYQRDDCRLWTIGLYLLSLHLPPFVHIPSLHPCLCHCGDEVVSIATTQELGVGALELELAEKDGLH